MIRKEIIKLFRVPPGTKMRLRDYDTGWAQTKELKELGTNVVKERASAILEQNPEDLAAAEARDHRGAADGRQRLGTEARRGVP